MSVVERQTAETRIRLEISNGDGHSTVATGHRFVDHMMVTTREILPPRSLASRVRRSEASPHRGHRNRLRRRHRRPYARDVRTLRAPHDPDGRRARGRSYRSRRAALLPRPGSQLAVRSLVSVVRGPRARDGTCAGGSRRRSTSHRRSRIQGTRPGAARRARSTPVRSSARREAFNGDAPTRRLSRRKGRSRRQRRPVRVVARRR